MRTVVIALAIVFAGFLVFSMSAIDDFANPPDELYVPLVDGVIDQPGVVYSATFAHAYDGRHRIAIAFENPSPIGQNYQLDGLQVSVVVMNGSVVILDEVFEEFVSPFWGLAHSGVALFTYEVPQDMPLSELLEVKFHVNSRFSAFEEKYGTLRLLVSKISEK